MSTCFVTVAISNFEQRHARPATRQVLLLKSDAEHSKTTSILIWSRNVLSRQVALAVQVTSRLLEFLENYFQVAFPMPKIDLIILPPSQSSPSAVTPDNGGLIAVG